MPKFPRTILLPAIALCLLAMAAFCIFSMESAEADEADDWPMFRLDYVHTGYREGLAPDTNQTMWTFDTGTNNRWIVSSPMIVDNYVYIGSENGKLYKIDLQDGTEVWNYTADEAGSWAHFWSSPYVDIENNMVLCHADGVHAIDLTTGERIWHFQDGIREFSSPVVHNGVVFVGSYDNCVYAIPQVDPNGDGTITKEELVWVYYSGEYQNGARIEDTGGAVSTTLAISNGIVFGAEQTQMDSGSSYCDYNAFALPEIDPDGSGEIEHGEIIWKYEIGEHLPVIDTGVPGEGGDCFSSPAVNVDENHLYIGSRDQFVYCLAIEPDGDGLDNDGDGIFDNEGELIWRTPVDNEIYASPSYHDESVFIASGMYSTAGSPGTVYCLDMSTGNEIWSYSNVDGFLSSPLVADEKVFIGCNDEVLYCMNESDGGMVWEYQATGANENAFGSSPSLYKDIIVIGNCNGMVYAFNTPRINYAPEIELLSPQRDTTFISTTDIELHWSGTDPNPGDDLRYDVYLSSDSDDVEDMKASARVATGQAEETYTLTDPEPGTSFFWRIVVSDGEFETISDVWDFRTNAPPGVELTDPESETTITVTTITLEWNGWDSDDEDITYTIFIGSDPDPDTIIEDEYEDTSIEIDDLLDGQTYYWKVTVRDALENVTSEIWHFTVDLAASSNIAPSILLETPENAAIIPETLVTLSWTGEDDDDDQLTYTLYFDTKTDPETMILEDTFDITYDVEDLDDGETYYWKVIVSDGIDSTTSEVWTFSIDLEFIANELPEIELRVPVDSYLSMQTTLTLQWQATDGDGDDLTYDVYLGIDPNATTIVSEDQTSYMYLCVNLQQNQTYYWYIVADDGTDEVTSEVRSFTVAPAEADDEKDEDKEWYEEITDEPAYIGGIAIVAVIIVLVVIFVIRSGGSGSEYDEYDDEYDDDSYDDDEDDW
jgi:eukaryotic-like serine/threonine-protein kinase